MNYSKMTSDEFPEWFVDLLLLRATDGLDEQQQRLFDKFVEEHSNPEKVESEAEKYELAVAAIDLKFQNSEPEKKDELPSDLRDKLLADAKQHFAVDDHEPEAAVTPAVELARRNQNRLSGREAFAWLIAAACVIALLTGWNPFSGEAPGQQGPDTVENVQVARIPTVSEQYQDFISGEEADLVSVSWESTSGATESGGVVWRDSAQEGYMVFSGLKPNDPTKSQYQLWIFDEKTGDKYPIDGGVFDVAAGKTVVKIDAKLKVRDPSLFAITEEEPGGVVVSTRERLPLLAKVGP